MSDTFTPDVAQQIPAGGGANTPASGEFGEKAALARLEQQLPQAEAEAEAEQGPSPLPAGSEAPITPPTEGLPRGLFAPSRQPDVPASTPLTEVPPPPSTPTEKVLRVLEILSDETNASVSRTTRQWARTVLESLGRE